ncbi:CLUMA_CG001636, isoform A [Clunio marinus]|uniref:CLUMA_CG001636, isoform A n=1 Tax=Clunio marinus TaxID=568069 RepID=A0A1J1HNP4_9DIPT|nr:CLUMA_CG001636, isoform A [Clunio marinus]
MVCNKFIKVNFNVIKHQTMTRFLHFTRKTKFPEAKLPHWSSGQVSELNASVLLQVPGSSPGMDKK